MRKKFSARMDALDCAAFRRKSRSMKTDWTLFGNTRDEEIPLFKSALLIALDEYPDLDTQYYEDVCDNWRASIAPQVERATSPIVALQALNRFLFDELGFSGNDDDYYDPRNSYINDVFERRLGIPISLAVMQMEVARRLGMQLEGVAFPGHFLVRLPVQGGVMVLDPYQRGRSLDVDELRQRAQPHVGSEDLGDQQLLRLLDPASHRAILTRMLRNLRSVYMERNDLERALRCADRLLTVDPTLAAEYRERARLYQSLGYSKGVVADLSQYLSLAPDADDSATVHQMLVDAQRGLVQTRIN
jgi:regulator of sirC expression with transglutaminase-like and TPR domain